MPLWPIVYNILDTGLPTKNETSETTVRNLYCQFPNMHDSLQQYKFLSSIVKSLIKPFKDHIQGRTLILNLESSYLKSFRSSLQSNPLLVTMINNTFFVRTTLGQFPLGILNEERNI